MGHRSQSNIMVPLICLQVWAASLSSPWHSSFLWSVSSDNYSQMVSCSSLHRGSREVQSTVPLPSRTLQQRRREDARLLSLTVAAKAEFGPKCKNIFKWLNLTSSSKYSSGLNFSLKQNLTKHCDWLAPKHAWKLTPDNFLAECEVCASFLQSVELAFRRGW